MMNWVEEVRTKIRKKNKILFSHDSIILQDLALLIEQQNHRALVLWAFELAEEAAGAIHERHPNEKRVYDAINICKEWAAGKVKMPIAQKAILQAHAVAKEITSLEDIALCHAVGQACGVVHTTGHAMGFPIYELTAIVRHHGIDNCEEHVTNRNKEYIDKMLYWNEHEKSYWGEWADFMKK